MNVVVQKVHVVVAGSGPAGLATAWAFAQRGLRVAVVDPNASAEGAPAEWPNRYATWVDEWPNEWRHVLTPIWPAAKVWFAQGDGIQLARPYARIDGNRLRRALADHFRAAGGAIVRGAVAEVETGPQRSRVRLTTGEHLDAGLFVDATGATSRLLRRAPGTATLFQTAYGRVVDASRVAGNPLPKEHADGCWLFDYRPWSGVPTGADRAADRAEDAKVADAEVTDTEDTDAEVPRTLVQNVPTGALAASSSWRRRAKPEEYRGLFRSGFCTPDPAEGGRGRLGVVLDQRPSFLYALPLGEGRVFVEETVLTSTGRVSIDELRQRLDVRLARWGFAAPVAAADAHDEERCCIPLNVPLPLADQPILGVGAAGGIVHPATGYQMARSMHLAALLAESLAPAIREGAAPERVAREGWQVLWPREARRIRRYQTFGSEVLSQMPSAELSDFFRAFFGGDGAGWADFMANRLTLSQLRSTMWATYVRSPPAVRRRLRNSAARHAFSLAFGN